MGILHSKGKDEETPIYPDSRNHRVSSGDSSPKLLWSSFFIYKALKGLLRKGRSIFYPAKPADPLLPVQNPASSISTEPLLVQTAPISSPNTYHYEDLECDSDLWYHEESYSAERDHHDQAVVSVHQLPGSTSDEETMCRAVSVEENAPSLEDVVVEIKSVVAVREESYSAERDHHDQVVVSVHQLSGSTSDEETMCRAVSVEDNAPFLEDEVVVEIKNVIVVREERWIKHYSSRHRILLVGEGNFSFSACLAVAFRCAPNIIATSLDSRAFLKEHYGNALTNIEELKSRGSKVMHGIDVATMANHQMLGQLKFDRIIFNFPYAGLKGVKDLPRESELERHKKLVRQFLENAREMIDEYGEIHITHKTNGFHREWGLVSLGRGCGLRLVDATKFNYLDYPGYNTMCGFGGNRYFNCNPSKTYKFNYK